VRSNYKTAVFFLAAQKSTLVMGNGDAIKSVIYVKRPQLRELCLKREIDKILIAQVLPFLSYVTHSIED